jgi:hypothetical protein
VGAAGVDKAVGAAAGMYAPQIAQNALDQGYLRNQNVVDNAGYSIQKRGYDSAYNAARRQPGYINNLYQNSLSSNDQDRLQQQIQNAANQRQYALINADRGDLTADRGDLAASRTDLDADWGSFQAQNADYRTGMTQAEAKQRADAATSAIAQGMAGDVMQGNVVFGKQELGRNLAQNTRSLDTGRRQYGSNIRNLNAQGRGLDARGRGLDERWSSTKDNEGLGNSRLSQIGLTRDRYGIQNREDLAGANDAITRADVARQYAGNQQFASNLRNSYDLSTSGNNLNQIAADQKNWALQNTPFFTQQAHDRVAAQQAAWDKKYTPYLDRVDQTQKALSAAKTAQANASGNNGWLAKAQANNYGFPTWQQATGTKSLGSWLSQQAGRVQGLWS